MKPKLALLSLALLAGADATQAALDPATVAAPTSVSTPEAGTGLAPVIGSGWFLIEPLLAKQGQ